MPRPKLEPDAKRAARLPEVRLTEGELASIRARAAQAGLSLSAFVRSMALGGQVVVKDTTAEVRLVRLLDGVANNINQLTRKAHIHDAYDAQRLQACLVQLDAVLSELQQ